MNLQVVFRKTRSYVTKTAVLLFLVLLIFSLLNLVAIYNKNAQISSYYSSTQVIEQTDNLGNSALCREIVDQYLLKFAAYLSTLEKVVIHQNMKLRRGLANSYIIYIRCLPDLEEFKNVLVHEIGHVIDLGFLRSESKSSPSAFRDFSKIVYADDASVDFYSLSFVNNTVLKAGIEDYDFVSGYAKSDPFEDFAESFMLYVRYNTLFTAWSFDSLILEQKYNYFEELLEDSLVEDENARIWLSSDNIRLYDATQLHKVY